MENKVLYKNLLFVEKSQKCIDKKVYEHLYLYRTN